MAGLAAHHFHEALAAAGIALHRRRGVAGPLGLVEDIRHDGIDGSRIARDILRTAHVGQIENLGHFGGWPEPLGITHPLDCPIAFQLACCLSQVGSDPSPVLQRMFCYLVAPVATQRANEMDAAIQVVRLRHVHNARVALRARGFDISAGQHRVVPVFHFLPAVQSLPASRLDVVARGMGRILECDAPVAPEMTGRAS